MDLKRGDRETVDRLQKYNPYKARDPKIKEKDVFIPDPIKRDFEGVLSSILRPDLFGSEMRYSGILLRGSAGTGKTLMAELLATLSNSLFLDAGKVSTPEQISLLYDTARITYKEQKKSVIIFIDEIDRFSKRENVVDPSQHAALNQLLMQLNGTEDNAGVYTVAATNMPESIDNALRRPKRLGKEIEILPPDRKGRHEILKIHAYTKDHKFAVDKDALEAIAEKTYGYTGADLVGLLIEAFVNANLESRKDVGKKDLEYALGKSVPSALRDMPYKEPKKHLSDIAGYDIHKDLLMRVMKASNENMFFLYGPSGCGKSAIPEAIAREFGYNLIVVEGSSLVDPFVGETGKKIDRVLGRAKILAPTILLFDEIGSLVQNKGWTGYKDTWTGLLQSKLSQPIPGVYIFASENDPERITDQVLQRFNYPVFLGLPANAEEYAKIWSVYAPEKMDVRKLAEMSSRNNLSPRHIENICKRVSEYGLPKEERVYLGITEKTVNTTPNYDDAKQKLGDRVSEYAGMVEFMKTLGVEKDGKVQAKTV